MTDAGFVLPGMRIDVLATDRPPSEGRDVKSTALQNILVLSNGQTIKASYTGVVPDTFKTGAEVVLKGRLGPDGFIVEHDGVMAKCPSKYEAKPTPATSGG